MSRRFKFNLKSLLTWPGTATLTPKERATVYRIQVFFLFLMCLAGAVKCFLMGRPLGALLGGAMAFLAMVLFFFGKLVRNR